MWQRFTVNWVAYAGIQRPNRFIGINYVPQSDPVGKQYWKIIQISFKNNFTPNKSNNFRTFLHGDSRIFFCKGKTKRISWLYAKRV